MKGTIAGNPKKPDGHAPGHPGMAPTWTSSAKDMVGCTLGSSRVWFTLGFGIVNEVYYPRIDTPQMRDLGFIVADGSGLWVEVKRLENYTVRLLAPGTPAVEVVHNCREQSCQRSPFRCCGRPLTSQKDEQIARHPWALLPETLS
jgi:hypothetical protein